MELNKLKQKVEEFEKKAGFDKTSADELIKMIEKEINILKSNLSNKEIMENKLVDLHVLLLQVAVRYNIDLDAEWERHFKRSEKYLE